MTGWTVLMVIAAALVPSFLISLVAVGWVREAAERLGLLDKPGARKVHTVPIPLGGGLGIWTGVVGTFALGTLAVWLVNQNSSLAVLLPDSISRHTAGLLGKA